MKIYGVRIYPQSVDVIQEGGAPIFVHGSVAEDCSNFFYIFSPLSSLWCGHFFADSFAVESRIDPLPGLRDSYGTSLIAADVKRQLLLLKGDNFADWGASAYFVEGALLPIFREPPSFDFLGRLYWNHDYHLTSKDWPRQMRAVMHMWDDIYWQLFSTERSDIEALIRAHVGDPKLKMYFVDFDCEYPDPSNGELQAAVLSSEH
ncbi:MAG: hypothetical protein LUO89_14405 [Methanothrix sp.]|nr:hypothetical protein [Methanothrix sp.]